MHSISSQVVLGIIIFAVMLVSLSVGVGIGFQLSNDYAYSGKNSLPPVVTDFESCIAAGNPAMESYPRKCRTADGLHFVEDVGDDLYKSDLVRVTSPRPNTLISGPIRIVGEARGYWFFEGDFPVEILDSEGNIIFEHFAIAEDEWMTEEFVPFTATFPLQASDLDTSGKIVLHKANPSGLSEHDDSFEIPVTFGGDINGTQTNCKPEQRGDDITCITVYRPVCGKVNVQCITAPCNPVLETFGNSCEACRNSLVESYTEGECK